jgi:hypothetical protein
MVASPRQRLILPLAPTGAGIAGVFTALMFAVVPSGALESLVVDSGIASLVNAAQPPLGLTARAVLALVGGGVISVLAWVALFVAVGTRSIILQNPRAAGNADPALRRADIHPDAPPRQPVFANRDLGTPFLDVRAPVKPAATERDLPADLDMPLALFDPHSFATPPGVAPTERSIAITRTEPTEAPLPIRFDTGLAIDRIAASMSEAPRSVRKEDHAEEPVAAPAPIRLDTGRAIDLIAASMQGAAVPPIVAAPEPEELPEAIIPSPHDTGRAINLIAASMQQPPAIKPPARSPDSIRALLDRLERSVAQREIAPPPAVPTRQARQESIRDTLDTLRGLATRAG